MELSPQIQQAVAQLTDAQRAELAADLIESLPNTHYWVEDAEVDRRCRELESGTVQGLTMEEFRSATRRHRSRNL